MNDIDPMTLSTSDAYPSASSTTLDTQATTRACALPQKRDLLTILRKKYGVSEEEMDSINSTGLMRIVATFDFLTNNLPPHSLQRGKP